VPGLGITYGRGGATTSLQDLQNADCILIEGSNMAEAHPVGFRHPMIAKERGAKLIHVDPRFTRTSAMCDIYAPIRPGTDIAFLGGLINYVIENEQYFEEYVTAYTNAATLITEGFEDADPTGIFSGWDEEKQEYSAESWRYEGQPLHHASVGGSQDSLVGEAGQGAPHAVMNCRICEPCSVVWPTRLVMTQAYGWPRYRWEGGSGVAAFSSVMPASVSRARWRQ